MYYVSENAVLSADRFCSHFTSTKSGVRSFAVLLKNSVKIFGKMGQEIIADFILDSNGHCFLCWGQGSRKHPHGAVFKQLSIHSIQHLSRFLKMSRRKVFNDKLPIPQQLLRKVEKSKLKVALCQDCATLIDHFSGAYLQLERIEMKISSCLNSIHGKLQRGLGREHDNKDLKLGNSSRNSNGGLMENMNIVEILRAEAIQKCSKKMNTFLPKIKLQKLTFKQISKAVSKSEGRQNSGFHFHRRNQNMKCSIIQDSGLKDEPENTLMDHQKPIKSECPAANSGKRTLKSVTAASEMPTPPVIGTSNSKEKNTWTINPETGKRRCKRCPYEFNDFPSFHNHYDSVHTKVRHKCTKCGKQFPYRSSLYLHNQSHHVGVRYISHDFKNSAPTKHQQLAKRGLDNDDDSYNETTGTGNHQFHKMTPSNNGVLKRRWTINPKTGRNKCVLCSYEFNTRAACDNHYDKIHLKLRYKCNLCEKVFPYKASLYSHHNSVHLKVKFKCESCNRAFNQKGHLKRHQQSCKCGPRDRVVSDKVKFTESDIQNFELCKVKMETYGHGSSMVDLDDDLKEPPQSTLNVNSLQVHQDPLKYATVFYPGEQLNDDPETI